MWSRLSCRASASASPIFCTGPGPRSALALTPFCSSISTLTLPSSNVGARPHRHRHRHHRHRTLSTLSTSIPCASSGSTATNFSVFIDQPKICTIVGAPLADGQPLVGVDKGPEYIRSQGCRRKLEADGWLVEDRGDLDFASLKHLHYAAGQDPNIKARQAQLVGAANCMLYQSVVEEARKNKFCLQLGGDHSIGIGSIAAVLKAHPDATIIWVDAHADINTPNGSASGNIHGMVVSFLMDLENSRKTAGFEWMCEVPLLKPSQLVYVGLRDLDAPEKQIIKQLGIKAFTMHEVDRYGIGEVMARAIDHITARAVRPIHLTFDIDSVDPLYAPSTGTRVAGGLTYREAYYICEAAAATGMLTSMDLVEVNPQLAGPEGSDMTVSMAVGLISSALGNKIL